MSSDDNNEKLISLSGKELTQNGKITKSHFFECLNIDLDRYDDVVYTEEEARRVQQHMLKLRTGSTAMVPMYCGGAERCPIADRCPLVRMGKIAVGRPCVIETSLLNTWIEQFIEEYGIDPNNFTEIGYVSELADIEVTLIRINAHLARPENALQLIDQPVGVDKDGEPVFQKAISPLAEQKDRLLRRKSQIIKLMVGDRQEKYKKQAALKQKPDTDMSTEQASIKKKMQDLQRQMDLMQGNVSEEFGPDEEGVLSPQEIIDGEEEDL